MYIVHVGGGIHSAIQNSNLQVLSTTIANNMAKSTGGGVYLGENHKCVTFSGTDIIENTAVESGGGMFMTRFSTEIFLVHCQVSRNTANNI